MTTIEELFSVRGKVALVTGAATGIGKMVATGLVQGGARVLIASRKGEACAAAADELNAPGAPGTAEGFAADVSTEPGLEALAAEVGRRTDRLHILVNNAGISWGAPFEEFPYHAWAKVLGVNVAGVFHLTRLLVPMLEKAGTREDPARIVNLGSVMGLQAVAEGAWSYNASKAAIHHLTKTLANELAPRRITVNAFAPGPFPSRMTDFATGTPQKAASVGARVPLGRIGRTDDIAGATLFLCGRAGSYVTGTILPIDGGQSVEHGLNVFGTD